MRRVALLFLMACGMPAAGFSGEPREPSAEAIQFFELEVRPLLARHCYSCHGASTQKAGLRLDSRASLLAGGKSGPAVMPGHPEASLLMRAIHYAGPKMPPDGKLSERQIAILSRWVALDSPWPETVRVTSPTEFRITDADRAYWAFQPLRRPPVPHVESSGSSVHPIDALVLARLEQEYVRPNELADRRTRIRRAYFDLIGLPPTPDEVAAFVDSDAPDAWPRLVEELLQRPQFGERWGRHWLDVVRFGQSNGYERDDEKLEAWRFRDYVIRSFNDDKPIDRFLLEQLAGDELDDADHDSIIATGYYRVGVWDDEPAEKTLARFDELDDIVRVTGAAMLGLTIGCARCHDHMFDPLSQQDYYAFLACFQNIAPYGRDKGGSSETHWEPDVQSIYTPLASLEQIIAWKSQQAKNQTRITQLRVELDQLKNDDSVKLHRKKLQDEIQQLVKSNDQRPFDQALSVRERGMTPEPTYLLVRGNPHDRGARVEPGIPAVLDGGGLWEAATARPAADHLLRRVLAEAGVLPASGRRRALAAWIVSPANPLSARVFVNRVWQHLLGEGIVATPNNFGRAGVPPTHPELLDWLADELIQHRWSLKHLIRAIMLSHVYQRSSRADREEPARIDPGNHLYWRQRLRRLEAESLRDAMLAVSGSLNLEMGGRGFFPELSKDVLATQSMPGHNWDNNSERERSRRSVYVFVKRTLMVPMFEAFDYTNTAEPLDVRPVTTVAPQALMLLNDKFVENQAAAFAARVAREAGDDPIDQIERAFQLALGRQPADQERTIARVLLDRDHREAGKFRESHDSGRESQANAELATSRSEALISLCRVILNLNEFLYVD